MILRNFISLRAFIVYMENSLRLFHFGQLDRNEICTEVSFIPPEVMWTLIMKLPHTELKFYPDVKSQTGLSSLRVSCKRALRNQTMIFIKAFLLVLLFFIYFQLVIVINAFMTEAVII